MGTEEVYFAEAADGLGMAILVDGEVGLLEAVDGPAVLAGDHDVDDDLARDDVEGLDRSGTSIEAGAGGARWRRPGQPEPRWEWRLTGDEQRGREDEGRLAETHCFSE